MLFDALKVSKQYGSLTKRETYVIKSETRPFARKHYQASDQNIVPKFFSERRANTNANVCAGEIPREDEFCISPELPVT
ncbi:hypothetical protein NPIL_383311, partial [Nephila pilipes]